MFSRREKCTKLFHASCLPNKTSDTRVNTCHDFIEIAANGKKKRKREQAILFWRKSSRVTITWLSAIWTNYHKTMNCRMAFSWCVKIEERQNQKWREWSSLFLTFTALSTRNLFPWVLPYISSIIWMLWIDCVRGFRGFVGNNKRRGISSCYNDNASAHTTAHRNKYHYSTIHIDPIWHRVTFFWFPKTKIHMKDQRFDDITDIQANVTCELNNVPKKKRGFLDSFTWLSECYVHMIQEKGRDRKIIERLKLALFSIFH